MCKIGGLSYLWLLLWLLLTLPQFIPIINLIATLGNFVLFGFIWYKIALARNKPAWMGILTVVPLAGFVFIGLLAFSD